MPFAHHSLSKTPRFHVPCILRFLLMCRIWSVILLLHSLLQNRSQFTRSPKYIACCSFSEPVQRIHGNRCAPQHLSSSEQSYRQAASLPVLNLFRKSRISEKDPTELPCFYLNCARRACSGSNERGGEGKNSFGCDHRHVILFPFPTSVPQICILSVTNKVASTQLC